MRIAKLIISLLIGALPLGNYVLAEENWGQFKGDIVATFLSDGRNMRIERPFSYIDPGGREWAVPAGMTTDGASVPRFFWTAFPPFTGRYRAAAVVHDYYCQLRTHTWRETHEIFYTGTRAAGEGEITAKAMYAAVYVFGPRWGIGTSPRGPGTDKYVTDDQQQAFYRDLEAWMKRENPSLQQIMEQLDQNAEVPKPR